jgi:hypothetical protein
MNEFATKWESPGPELAKIAKALIIDEVRDCGEFHVRRSLKNEAKYLVAGTNDGVTWNYYFVWTDLRQVAGPLPDDYGKPY